MFGHRRHVIGGRALEVGRARVWFTRTRMCGVAPNLTVTLSLTLVQSLIVDPDRDHDPDPDPVPDPGPNPNP